MTNLTGGQVTLILRGKIKVQEIVMNYYKATTIIIICGLLDTMHHLAIKIIDYL